MNDNQIHENPGEPLPRKGTEIQVGPEKPLPHHDLREDSKDREKPGSIRDQNADRAYRAAVSGLIVWPLQLYAIWLVFKVIFDKGALDNRACKRTFLAALISVSFVVFGSLAGLAALGYFRAADPEIDPRQLNRPISLMGTWEARAKLPEGEIAITMDLHQNGDMQYKSATLEFAGCWGYGQNGIIYRLDHIVRGDSRDKGRVFIFPVLEWKEGEMMIKFDDNIKTRFTLRR